MNKRRHLIKVLAVLAFIVGLAGLVRIPATVQPQAQATSAVAFVMMVPTGPQTQVNWNS